MSKPLDFKKIITTPENKREFIQQWLEENVYIHPHFTASNEKTPPSSPILKQKYLESNKSSVSPILGGKRSALSPIIGSRKKILKRGKITKKSVINDFNENENFSLILETVKEKSPRLKNSQKCDESSPCFEDKYNLSLTETIKISGCHEISSSSSITEFNSKHLPKVSTTEQLESQFIESVSSEDKNTEINVQEVNSDSDKTASDLIEEISTQLILETPYKQSKTPLSQNISNPSSITTETNDTHISEFIATQLSTNQQSLETVTPADLIDSVSTLESKVDFSKISYILQYTNNKEKKKKNPKKGSLLDALITTMSKERSNVNLLRHQLNKNVVFTTEKPFILLGVMQHLPMINENQLLKCILLKNAMNSLNDPIKHMIDQFVTVLIVPEISGKVNVSQKPILKVYQPWTIINPNQLLLHITRFIAIQITDAEEFDINKNICKEDMKIIHKFHCPCIEEKELSIRCNAKDHDTPNNVTKIVFDYT